MHNSVAGALQKRHGLYNTDFTRKAASTNREAAKAFHPESKKAIEDGKYKPEIFITNEISL